MPQPFCPNLRLNRTGVSPSAVRQIYRKTKNKNIQTTGTPASLTKNKRYLLPAACAPTRPHPVFIIGSSRLEAHQNSSHPALRRGPNGRPALLVTSAVPRLISTATSRNPANHCTTTTRRQVLRLDVTPVYLCPFRRSHNFGFLPRLNPLV